MTATRLVTIMCDAPNCGVWWDAGVADTAQQARHRLRGTGWALAVADPAGGHHTLDYCPRHATPAPPAGRSLSTPDPAAGALFQAGPGHGPSHTQAGGQPTTVTRSGRSEQGVRRPRVDRDPVVGPAPRTGQ